MVTLRDYIENILAIEGCLEITEGVWIHTQESIISEQNSWDNDDKYKHYDFTQDEYWLISDPNSSDDRGLFPSFETIDQALGYYFR